MMDKAWAARAGLGWIGKHTNLITTEYGSWVFIGELLLNLDLEYDTRTRRGSTAAVARFASMPARHKRLPNPTWLTQTSAFPSATIELRDPELPQPVTENLEGWFYGCDICQDVCPWNRFEQATDEAALSTARGKRQRSLAEGAGELTPEDLR